MVMEAIVYLYTMLYKYGNHMHDFMVYFYFLLCLSFLCFEGIFNKTITQFMLAGYEMVMAD